MSNLLTRGMGTQQSLVTRGLSLAEVITVPEIPRSSSGGAFAIRPQDILFPKIVEIPFDIQKVESVQIKIPFKITRLLSKVKIPLIIRKVKLSISKVPISSKISKINISLNIEKIKFNGEIKDVRD